MWAALSAGGQAVQCGGLKDRYGLSWQVVPPILERLMSGPDPARGDRVMRAILGMVKLDIQALQAARDGR